MSGKLKNPCEIESYSQKELIQFSESECQVFPRFWVFPLSQLQDHESWRLETQVTLEIHVRIPQLLDIYRESSGMVARNVVVLR